MKNNLKTIREIYGATQEQIAEALNVSRVTIANWESGVSKASNVNKEKLSLYYGVGPEYFYDAELTEEIKLIVQNSSKHAAEIVEKSNGKRIKEADFHEAFETLTFKESLKKYMFSMKMMLATADKSDLETLKTAVLIHDKMGNRLKALLTVREEELNSGGQTLDQLLNNIKPD